MKKLLLVFLLFGSMVAKSQLKPSYSQNYTPISQRYNWLAGYFRALGLPSGCDTATAFQPGQWIGKGAIYVDTCAQKVYVWVGFWKELGGGGGGTDSITNARIGGKAASVFINNLVNSTLPIIPTAFHPNGFREFDIIPADDGTGDYELFYTVLNDTRYIRFHSPSDLQSKVGTVADSVISGLRFPSVLKVNGRYYLYGTNIADNNIWWVAGSTIAELQTSTRRMALGIPALAYDFDLSESPWGGYMATAVVDGQAAFLTSPSLRGEWVYRGKIFDALKYYTGDSSQFLNPNYAEDQADPMLINKDGRVFLMFNGKNVGHPGKPSTSHQCVVELDTNYRANGRAVEFIKIPDRPMHHLYNDSLVAVGNPVYINIEGREEVWYVWSKLYPDTGWIAHFSISDNFSTLGWGGRDASVSAIPGFRADLTSNILHTFYGANIFNRDSAFVTTSGGNNGLWNFLSTGTNLRNFKLHCNFSLSSLPADSCTVFRIVGESASELKLMVNSSGVKRLIYKNAASTQTNYLVPGTVSTGVRYDFDLIWNVDLGIISVDGGSFFGFPGGGDYMNDVRIYSLFNDSTDVKPPGHQMTGAIYSFYINLLQNYNNFFSPWSQWDNTLFNSIHSEKEVLIERTTDAGDYALQTGNDIFIKGDANRLYKIDIGSTSGGYNNGGEINFQGAGNGSSSGTIASVKGTFNSDGDVGQLEFAQNSASSIYMRGGDLLMPASRYINWGSTRGTSGYGFRDNSGTMEFKNSGGSWTPFGGGSGGYFNPDQTSTGNTTHDANYKNFTVNNIGTSQYIHGVSGNYSDLLQDSTLISLYALHNAGSISSQIDLRPDSIRLLPFAGRLNIDSLRSGAGTKSIHWDHTTGIVSYAPTGWDGTFVGTSTSTSTSVTLSSAIQFYVFTGISSDATYTLPALSASNGQTWFIKNRSGAGKNIILTRAGSDQIAYPSTSPGTTVTIPDGGSLAVYGNTSYWDVFFFDKTPALHTLSKGKTIELPSNAENIGMWKTPVAITISDVQSVLVGSASPSVTFNIAFGSDRTSGTNVFTSGQTVTSTTTGLNSASGFNDFTIPAGSFIWITTSAQSGTVSQIEITINYTED